MPVEQTFQGDWNEAKTSEYRGGLTLCAAPGRLLSLSAQRNKEQHRGTLSVNLSFHHDHRDRASKVTCQFTSFFSFSNTRLDLGLDQVPT
jgi:hypothetical protein